jgi:hypothetical protein
VTGLGSIDANNLVTNWTKLPYLSITALTSDTNVLIGGTINVSFTVANLGGGASGTFRIGAYLSNLAHISIEPNTVCLL